MLNQPFELIWDAQSDKMCKATEKATACLLRNSCKIYTKRRGGYVHGNSLPTALHYCKKQKPIKNKQLQQQNKTNKERERKKKKKNYNKKTGKKEEEKEKKKPNQTNKQTNKQDTHSVYANLQLPFTNT